MFFLESLAVSRWWPSGCWHLISGSSAFSKTSLNIRKFTVHILLKPGLENFEHYFTSVWNECNCAVVWEGNGNPLQYSCLENPMDRRAWWATVHGVAKGWTWLSKFTFTFLFHNMQFLDRMAQGVSSPTVKQLTWILVCWALISPSFEKRKKKKRKLS